MVLHTLITVSLLFLLVLVTRRAVARHFGPRVAYALWLLPFTRLIMPAIALPASWRPDIFTTPEPVATPDTLSPEALQALLMVAETQPAEIILSEPFPLVGTFAALWVAGIVAGLLWLLINQRHHATRMRTTSIPASQALRGDSERAARLAGLTEVPTVRTSLKDEGPFVSGLLRPVIILPHDFETRFTAEQRRLALLHEMLHVKRGDLWTASAMMLFRIANWPNPIIHWAWPRFRADQEAACDASVLRCTGEASRGDYAETLLSAVKTSGRASPFTGTGLTLSLNHPVKERLMTLGSKNTQTRRATRWALGALLLTGTAISAPLSFADGPAQVDVDKEVVIETPVKGTAVTRNVSRWVVTDNDNGDYNSFEIRDDNGERTYLRVSRDGTTEKLTHEEFMAEYGDDLEKMELPARIRLGQAVDGEPGLTALSRGQNGLTELQTVILSKAGEGEQNIRVEVEDGQRRIFKVAPDGTETELNIDVLGDESEVKLRILKDMDITTLPGGVGENVMIFRSDNATNLFGSGSGEGLFADGENRFFFGTGGLASSEARLRSAQSMIEATNRMLEDMQEDANGADRDLRSAEKELEKAQKALEKAMDAMRKSEER